MSWPHSTAEGSSDDPAVQAQQGAVLLPSTDVMCYSFATTRDMFTAGTESMCHPRDVGPPSFQAATDVLARFSPAQDDMARYYPDAENQEFLNNYFYCGKQEEAFLPQPRYVNAEATGWTDPCVGNETFCTAMGVENVCAGFNFLFTTDGTARNPSMPTGNRERVLSVGPAREARATWMGVLDMASSRFSFAGNGANNDNKNLYQPPCLKKTCSPTPRRPSSPPRLERQPSRDQIIDEALGA
jgi:hypothetical protein